MQVVLRALSCALLCLLVACGSGGKARRVFPPTASIQQLTVLEDGRWELLLRVQNFSNVGMRISAVDARLDLGEVEAATVSEAPGFVVPANSVEVLQAIVVPQPAAREPVAAVLRGGASLRYRLSGRIRSSEPDRRDDAFEFASALAPVPGLPGTLR